MELDGIVTRDELEESSVLHTLATNNMATINDYPGLVKARVHTSIENINKKPLYTVNALTRVISSPN